MPNPHSGLFFLVVDKQVAGVKVGQLEREGANPEFTFDIAVRQDLASGNGR